MKEWENLLIQAIRNNPDVQKKLENLMWLDEFLMEAIAKAPQKDHPEMMQAWTLCIEIARELGLPEQQGADWLSYNATSIGKRLGIKPLQPR